MCFVLVCGMLDMFVCLRVVLSGVFGYTRDCGVCVFAYVLVCCL